MAETNDTQVNDREFFALPSAYGMLADAARERYPEIFKSAAHMLDMAPSQIMRGVAYLSYLLAHVSVDEEDADQRRVAMSMLAGISALAARLIEHQNIAEIDEWITAKH